MTNKITRAFTLIELLVVIAIIAILAAILFPVFAQAREKARQITCVSNVKEVALAFLQYTNDYDECMPIAFYDGASYGPLDAAANTNGYGGGVGQASGISNELQPYVKSWGVFTCPDDWTVQAGDTSTISSKKVPPGIGSVAGFTTCATNGQGCDFSQLYGTSYSLTHETESNPNPWTGAGSSVPETSSAYNGYYTSLPCANANIRAATSGITPAGGLGDTPGKLDCDIKADNEPINGCCGNGTWTNDGNDTVAGVTGISISQLSLFTRPSETRLLHENLETYVDAPTQPHFHPNGTVYAFVDGHAKFLSSKYQSSIGCDGLDWAGDYAGSCNTRGYQRGAE